MLRQEVWRCSVSYSTYLEQNGGFGVADRLAHGLHPRPPKTCPVIKHVDFSASTKTLDQADESPDTQILAGERASNGVLLGFSLGFDV